MRWPWLSPTPGEVGAMVFGIAVVAAFVFIVVRYPDWQRKSANFGFGPEWQCTPVAQGGPVCIKKPSPAR
jgi:hypothetical protein